MMRFFAVAIAATIMTGDAFAASPHTAQITDVADAFEPDNPFDFRANVGFRRVSKRTRITREATTGPESTFVDELQYEQTTNLLDIGAQLSIYKDLEVTFYMPYTFNQDARWTYRDQVNETNSTITNDPTLGVPLHGVPHRTYKNGLSFMDIGLSWSPLNDQRDDTKPTMTIRALYSAPIGAAFNPQRSDDLVVDNGLRAAQSNGVDPTSPAPVGDKVHRLKLELGASKRFGPVDPYIVLNYHQPFSDRLAPAGMQAPIVGGFTTGFEIIPWDVPHERQRLSFDLRVSTQFISSGRTYSEMTDTLRQLTWVDNYTNFNGGLHMVVQPIQYVRLSAGINFGYDTTHLITNENPGSPGADGEVDLNDPAERNPRYRPEIDSPGRRFRAEDSWNFTFYVNLMLLL